MISQERIQKLPNWIKRILNFLQKMKVPGKMVYILISVLATIWFLIRVIPKPTRATYPCMQVAAPIMSGFVIWLLAILGATFAFKKAKHKLFEAKYIAAGLFLILGIAATYIFTAQSAEKICAENQGIWYKSNIPLGVARGINPGRVAWGHNTQIASWDGKTGSWWEDQFNNEAETDQLLSQTLFSLTNIKNEKKSWDALFRFFNKTKRSVDAGYQTGQKVAIKVNLNNTYSHESNNEINANPTLILSLLKSLVIEAGIQQENITLTDPSRFITNNIETPGGLQTFSPRSTQNTTVWFTNNTGKEVKDLTLSIAVPSSWKSVVLSSGINAKKFTQAIAPGETVSATFSVTSGMETFNGDLVGKATWIISGSDKMQSDIAIEKVRNVNPIKINEFRISDGSAENSTNSFIELYNAGDNDVDISNWTLTHHAAQTPIFSSIKMPAGTKLTARGFYLLGLSNSGLSVPAKKGESTICVRNTTGISVGDVVKIGMGSMMETRKVVSIAVPAEPEANNQTQGGRRRMPAGAATTVWQPLPDGPVITIPAGSTNIPVTNIAGMAVGQKVALGYGATYPAVSRDIEKYEVVTITNVGKQGTQAWLSMDAKVGETNIKVSSVANISVGDKIRLDIESKGHGIETVTVKSVGTQSVRSTFNNPLKPNEDPGTGLELMEPLKYDHASNMPFSARGTGISFTPATSYPHSSNEPVLPLVFAIKLDQPLTYGHDIDDVVRDEKVTTAGYNAIPAPQQWFGGPALSSSGNMVLRDAKGLVVDGLNYGGVVDPWSAEGYQALSGASENGCFAPSPGGNRGFRMDMAAPAQSQPNISTGRYPDGADIDDNERDFQVQSAVNMLASAPAGTNNIKVVSLQNFNIGQRLFIGSGSSCESAIIATIGTPGCTTVGTTVNSGSTVIPVLGMEGFSVGQTITIGSGANPEKVVIASISVPRRRGGFGGRNQNAPVVTDTIMVSLPLKNSYETGVLVSGSGITLTAQLTKNHIRGELIASDLPTPGMPNRFYRKL